MEIVEQKKLEKNSCVNSVYFVQVFPPQKPYVTIPDESNWRKDPRAAYLYYCANETIHGIEFPRAPDTLEGVPLVADVSSNVLSRPFSFEKVRLVANISNWEAKAVLETSSDRVTIIRILKSRFKIILFFSKVSEHGVFGFS